MSSDDSTPAPDDEIQDDSTAVPETPVEPVGEDAEVDLFRLPFRLLATSAEIGRQVTGDVWSRSWAITRDVVDGARHGRPPADLANTVIDGTVETIRDVIGIATEHAPAQAEPMAQAVNRVAGSLPEAVGNRLTSATQFTQNFTGGTVRDVRRQLREQGQELLRRSTALDDPEEHPSFRYILRQMAPDEARILRFLAVEGPQPIVDVVEYNAMTRDSREVSRHVSLLGEESGCLRPSLTKVYVDNLARLGVIDVRDYRVGGQEAYDLLEAQPGVDELPKPAGLMTKHRVLYKSVDLSEFGRQVFAMCFATDGEAPSDDDE